MYSNVFTQLWIFDKNLNDVCFKEDVQPCQFFTELIAFLKEERSGKKYETV